MSKTVEQARLYCSPPTPTWLFYEVHLEPWFVNWFQIKVYWSSPPRSLPKLQEMLIWFDERNDASTIWELVRALDLSPTGWTRTAKF